MSHLTNLLTIFISMSDKPVKRGRPKKSEQNQIEQTPVEQAPIYRGFRSTPLHLENAPKDDRGFIKWRELVNKEHVVLNRAVFAKKGVDVFTISEEERNKYLESSPDDHKIIRLAGFRDLARLRGYTDVSQKVEMIGDSVTVTCSISFAPLEETRWQTVSYTGIGSASFNDVAPDYRCFLPAIASNRAFCRCVREYLGITSVSEEELNPNDKVEVAKTSSPLALVKEKCLEKGISFDVLKLELAGRGLETENWVTFDDMPISVCFAALESIKTLG